LITHGLNGRTEGWVTGMANAFSSRQGGNTPLYRAQVSENSGTLTTSVVKVSGGVFPADGRGEIILMLDWRPPVADGNSYTTLEVATAVAPLFTQTNVISELAGSALAELPIHLIGHSRGGSLICELSRLLGNAGIWVDHLTGLDAHPLNNDGFNDFIYSIVDPSVMNYENVLFSESYYQTAAFFADGLVIPGSTWRRLTEFGGGYDGVDSSHSDVHLWYHGSIDLGAPITDGEADITSTMRNTWWSAAEHSGTNTGFLYSRLGGGDRLSTNQPNASESSPIREGFNRYYDVGGGAGPNNRTAGGSNSGEWPNPIRFELLTTNLVEYGDTATMDIYFQWAQPSTSTQTVQVLADTDLNPLNGNEVLLEDGFATGTAMAEVGHGTIEVGFDGRTLAAGNYNLFVRMIAGGRSRILYAPQPIQVSAGVQPLTLNIMAATNSAVLLGINGAAGQTAVLERSADGSPWLPVATNTLTSTRWEIMEPVDPASTMTLFRAVAVNP